MNPRHAALAPVAAIILAACGPAPAGPAGSTPASPPASAAAVAGSTVPTLDASCTTGWDLNPPGNFTTSPPSIPGNVPFADLDAFNYSGQGNPWVYSSWNAFLATMLAAEVTLTNPVSGEMTPTQSATVVYFDSDGTELESATVSIVNTELMPGQTASAEDFPPAGTASCMVVLWK
jgi:hypothetical protein